MISEIPRNWFLYRHLSKRNKDASPLCVQYKAVRSPKQVLCRDTRKGTQAFLHNPLGYTSNDNKQRCYHHYEPYHKVQYQQPFILESAKYLKYNNKAIANDDIK